MNLAMFISLLVSDAIQPSSVCKRFDILMVVVSGIMALDKDTQARSARMTVLQTDQKTLVTAEDDQ